MKVFDTPQIRNLALVGHGGCGKTSLVSTLLFDMGAENRIGRVDDGTAPTDFDPDEQDRKISLQLALAHGEWRSHKLNLLDAPGYANFVSEARSALRAADAAIVVVDAVSGVEVQTEKLWASAAEADLPRLIVVNRMDRDRASFERTLESLQAAFGREVTPLGLPIGEESGFKGIANLLTQRAHVYTDESGTFETQELPADIQERAAAARDQLVEMVAESDEALMEEFFEKGTLPAEDLAKGLRLAIQQGKVFPVLPASALGNVGLHTLLDAIVELMPSPADRGAIEGRRPESDEIVMREPSSDAPAAAFVFKTIADPHAGRITLLRVHSGTLHSDSSLQNTTRGTTERIGQLLQLLGKNQTPVKELRAGDIGAVAKLKDTHTGDTLADKGDPVVFVPVSFPEPATTFAMEPKTRGDEDKISAALHRLMEEDPVLHVVQDEQTKEMLLSGMGQLHIEVAVGRLKRRYKVDVELRTPKIPYRETIGGSAEGHGRHKKQTGGHGQFGDCKIRMSPLPRGAGFEFSNDIFGGSIPKNYIPAVEKGVIAAAQRGFLAGYPVVDFKVELYDGQYHDVDSSEMAFKIAGSLGFKDAVAKCKPTLLEPVMHVEIYVPEEYAGAVMGDLASRRGRPQGMEPKGNQQLIRAEVPLSEMLAYDAELTSMTGGRGSYHMEKSHYDEVPSHLQEKIAAGAASGRDDEDES
jgi:elongation factor G